MSEARGGGRTTCPACSANAFDANGICGRCGYAEGEANRCPHCGAVARLNGEGRKAVCAVCEGPRIPNNLGGEVAANALRQQQTLLGQAKLGSIVTVAQGILATIVCVIGMAIHPAMMGTIIVAVLAGLPLLFSVRTRIRTARFRREGADAGDRAWQAAAEAMAHGGITAKRLAERLSLAPAEADKLLTALAVEDRTRVDIGDDAEVVYSTEENDAAIADERRR